MRTWSWGVPVAKTSRVGAVLVLLATMVLSVAAPVTAGSVQARAMWGYAQSLKAGAADGATTQGPCVHRVSRQCLYSIGGETGIKFSKTVTMYSPQRNRWTAVAPLKVGRGNDGAASGPCVAAVRKTCVYVISGQNSFTSTTEVDMFDPARNSWRTVSPLHQARANLAAASAPCLRALHRTCLYAFGGLLNNQSNNLLATVEMFNPYTNSWRFAPSLPAAATELAGASGRCESRESRRCLYALGGMNTSFHIVSSLVRFDPATGDWQTRASMRMARVEFGAAFSSCSPGSAASCLFAVAGAARPVPCGPVTCHASVNAVDRYDPAANRWFSAAGLNTPRSELGAAAAPCPKRAARDCVYAVGGLADSTANNLRTVEVYGANAPQNIPGVWTYVNGMLSWRRGLGAAAAPCPAARGRTCLYAVGGSGYANPYATAEVFHPATNIWSPIASLQTPRQWAGTTSGPCRSKAHRTCVYSVGGVGGTGALGSVESYNPAQNKWSATASLPKPRFFAGVVTAPCRRHMAHRCLYAVAGSDAKSMPIGTVEMYNPASNAWSSVASLAQPRSGLASTAAPCQGARHRICVYALGGYGLGMQAEGTVMMYDPASNTWRSVAAMPTARYGLTASTGPCGGSTARMCIYAAGGIGTSKATLATVQRYDPATNQWQTMPPLHSDLEQSVAVTGPCHGESTGKCIYVLGGTTGFQEDVLFSVETFQPSR